MYTIHQHTTFRQLFLADSIQQHKCSQTCLHTWCTSTELNMTTTRWHIRIKTSCSVWVPSRTVHCVAILFTDCRALLTSTGVIVIVVISCVSNQNLWPPIHSWLTVLYWKCNHIVAPLYHIVLNTNFVHHHSFMFYICLVGWFIRKTGYIWDEIHSYTCRGLGVLLKDPTEAAW